MAEAASASSSISGEELLNNKKNDRLSPKLSHRCIVLPSLRYLLAQMTRSEVGQHLLMGKILDQPTVFPIQGTTSVPE